MIALLCLIISSSALKLQQDPEFDVTDAVYDEECGNRYNYKCWKKGGHSLDKKDSTTTAAATTTAEGEGDKQEEATTPKFSITYQQTDCQGSKLDSYDVSHGGQPVCGECYKWTSAGTGGGVNYVMFRNINTNSEKGNNLWTWTTGLSAPTGCKTDGKAKQSSHSYAPGSGQKCQKIQEPDTSKGAEPSYGLSMTKYNFPDCVGSD